MRAALGCWLLTAALALAACSGGNKDRGVDASISTSTTASVAITSSTGLVTMNAGESLTLTATVTNDTNSAGVTWALSGDGAISSLTKTSVVYTAAAAISGNSTPVITATAVIDSAQIASATLLVSGTPIIFPVPMFPANVGSAYAAGVTVLGGVAPYTWSVTSGAFPDGITEAGSTGSSETLSGTPTTTGTYPFQMTAKDANGLTASVNLTLVVNSPLTCLLTGQFAFLTTGTTNTQIGARAASINVDVNGNVTGIVDRKQPGATASGESWTGTCMNRAGNSGQLTLTGSTDSPVFNFSVPSSLKLARVQLTSGGDGTSASGQLYQQTPADFSLTKLAGSFAFGLLGAESAGNHAGYVGQLTVSANGTVTAGRIDSNTTSVLTAATLTGTMSAPDANGRGTLVLSGGSQTLKLAYYVVNASRLLLVNSDSAASAPALGGFMTRRVASFNASSLTGSSVLSLWGAAGVIQPTSVLTMGQISGANTSTGAFNMVLDTANHSTTEAGVVPTATTYSVESDGRVTLNFTTGTTVRQLIGYLDAASNGYVVERGSSTGNAGLLEAQMAGPFSSTVDGLFVAGTQFPQTASPLALMPVTYLNSGNITSSSASGYVAVDSVTGRGLGSLSITGLGGVATALYIVSPTKVLLLRFGSTSQNGAIEWLIQ
jgi:hypothetical protein